MTDHRQAVAHVSKEAPYEVHLLDEHLLRVEQQTERLAAKFSADQWGKLAGRWHDLGKFSSDFQHYIRGASGYEANTVDTVPGRVNHSSAGALLAVDRFGSLGLPLAYLIAGHHAGLPDWSSVETAGRTLESRLRDGRKQGLLAKAIEGSTNQCLESARPSLAANNFGGSPGLHLWIRMLFSCLVDADFLDTEAFMQPGQSNLRGNYPEISVLVAQLNDWMEDLAQSTASSHINQIRAEVLRECREKASGAPGLYTLTVPTGGGKTLSSLTFAMDHAVRYRKDRVIYAIPYTSIIEQTADVFRQIFGDAILEHHSNLDAEHESPKSRLAAENWDAPLIVTTNVQLFESLFAARSSRCRKLHNIVNSVIILDEAQLLPPEFLQPILGALQLLIKYYGVTVVLCTATQPALETQVGGHGHTILRGLDSGTEIVAEPASLYSALNRVQIHLPRDLAQPEEWETLATRLQEHGCVLAIVNTRAACRKLHSLMPKGTRHLSALMCGEHRSNVIAEIKAKLGNHEPVRVVSTQLIEAGVDVDFPVVYRALSGLDSIAQAAGRCNREGIMPRKGQVFVFVPPERSPSGLLRFGEDACRLILDDHPENPLVQEQFHRYFQQYYARASHDRGLDRHGILDLLTKDAAQCHIQFRTAAERFRMIDDEASVTIIVPYVNPTNPAHDSRPLLARLQAGEMHRDLLRQLQRYTVSVGQHDWLGLYQDGELEQPSPGSWVLRNETRYSDELGLLVGNAGLLAPEKLYC